MMYHYDKGHISNCSKCRHVAEVPGCIFHEGYKASKDNYPCDVNGHRLMTLKEANEILECHGIGYSTSEFVQALQVREERNELIKKDKKNDEDGKN